MIKSFLNYPGGKYSLLPQLLPLFPPKYKNFIDMFAGSCVVSINSSLNVPIYSFDNNEKLVNLLNFVKYNSVKDIFMYLKLIIKRYNLTETSLHGYKYYNLSSYKGVSSYNKKGYTSLREDYNKKIFNGIPEEIYLYALIVFGFNNQIRFNNKGLFNNPTGKRDFNMKMQKKLLEFSDKIKTRKIRIEFSDFGDIREDISDGFYYADPPYLITNAVYNESGGWTENDEKRLLLKLERIDNLGNKFALSNVITSKGKTNYILKEWSKKYNVYHLNSNYSNSSYQSHNKEFTDEVLITNYDT